MSNQNNGICVRNCKIIGFPDNDSIKDLPDGTLVEFIVTQGSNQVIRVFTYENCTLKREKPLYVTSADNLQSVEKEMWPFLIAVKNETERVEMVRNRPLLDFISKKVKVNDGVFIKSDKTGDDYVRGIVKYIALVPDLGSGFYFGVEIPQNKLVIPDQSINNTKIPLTVVVSAQSIKPGEIYNLNNNSSSIDFNEDEYYTKNQRVNKNVLKRRVSKEEEIEDEYTKNQKISPNMENTFEKFMELKNLQSVESLIKIDSVEKKHNQSLNDSFSRMSIENNYNNDSVVTESIKMVAELSKKYEQNAGENKAQKYAAILKRNENLNRRKSKDTEDAINKINYDENQNMSERYGKVLTKTDEGENICLEKYLEQMKAGEKTQAATQNRRKSNETVGALYTHKMNYDKNESIKKSTANELINKIESTNENRKTKTYEGENFNLEKHLEAMKAEETKKAQDAMLFERKMKLQREYSPKNNELDNIINQSDDSYLNHNSAEVLKNLKADAKKVQRQREAKQSKEDTAKLLAERTKKMGACYTAEKIGMKADSMVKTNQSEEKRFSYSKYSTTDIDQHKQENQNHQNHYPSGAPKSTGAIKKNYSKSFNEKQKTPTVDEFEYYRKKHERSEAYNNYNSILKNEETEGASALPDYLKHLFLKNPSTWTCQKCTCENSINDIKCIACNEDVVCEIPENLQKYAETQNFKSSETSYYEEYTDKGKEIPIIKEDPDISSEFIDDDHDVVPNGDEFECSICLYTFAPGVGVVLRDCIHCFCKTCLRAHIIQTLDSEIKCPFNQNYTCDSNLQDREIKGIVGQEIYNEYLAKSAYEIQRDVNIFHCRKDGCMGYGFIEENQINMKCPICGCMNCNVCKTIHEGMKCSEYMQKNDDKFKKVEKNDKNSKTLLLRPYSVPAGEYWCSFCENMNARDKGIFLEKCSHSICISCLKDTLRQSNQQKIKCPQINCKILIEEELKQSVLQREQYMHYMHRVKYNFNCTNPACDGWFTISANPAKNAKQKCPKCSMINCITCNAIHVKLNCKEFQKLSHIPTDEKKKWYKK